MLSCQFILSSYGMLSCQLICANYQSVLHCPMKISFLRWPRVNFFTGQRPVRKLIFAGTALWLGARAISMGGSKDQNATDPPTGFVGFAQRRCDLELAARHDLPPRHLETLLQALVRVGILKGVRGPRGGYELARERRRITAGDIARAAMQETGDDGLGPAPRSTLVEEVIAPEVARASRAFLAVLDDVTIEELCHRAQASGNLPAPEARADFTI